ncbi:hypothetical protein [Terrabacter koreensis]
MGWLSRTFRSGDDTSASAPAAPQEHPESPAGQSGPPVPLAPHPVPVGVAAGAGAAPTPDPVPAPAPDRSSTAAGRYGQLVSVTHFDTAPPELEWQLPLNGELYRLMPGSDRPDYSLFVLERPVHFYPGDGFDVGRVEPEQRVEDRKGRPMVRVHAMLLCARFVGQQLHPGMKDLAVNLAYVIDNSLARDAEVDFGKIEFAAVGFLSEGHSTRPGDAATRHTATGASDDGGVGAVLDEVGAVLRQGIEAQRGTSVQRLTAALTLDADHRLTGLSGNADGQAPVPTPDTFTRLADVLARLGHQGGTGGPGVAAFTVRVEGDTVSHEVTATR